MSNCFFLNVVHRYRLDHDLLNNAFQCSHNVKVMDQDKLLDASSPIIDEVLGSDYSDDALPDICSDLVVSIAKKRRKYLKQNPEKARSPSVKNAAAAKNAAVPAVATLVPVATPVVSLYCLSCNFTGVLQHPLDCS